MLLFNGVSVSKARHDIAKQPVEIDESRSNDLSSSAPNGTPHLPSSEPTVNGLDDTEQELPSSAAANVPAPTKKAIFTPAMRESFGQLMDNLQEMTAFIERLECAFCFPHEYISLWRYVGRLTLI